MEKFRNVRTLIFASMTLMIVCFGCSGGSSDDPSLAAGQYSGIFTGSEYSGQFEFVLTDDGILAATATVDNVSAFPFLLSGTSTAEGGFEILSGYGSAELEFTGETNSHGSVSGTWGNEADSGTLEGSYDGSFDDGITYVFSFGGTWAVRYTPEGGSQEDYYIERVECHDFGYCSYKIGSDRYPADIPKYFSRQGLCYILSMIIEGSPEFSPEDISVSNDVITVTGVDGVVILERSDG